MSTIKAVQVIYTGEMLNVMEQTFGGTAAGMTDLRFQPFASMNEDLHKEVAIIKVDKWLMDASFRLKADEGRAFYETRLHSALDVNAYLTILSHFGFDADYYTPFVRKLEPMIADVMLHAYRINPDDRISAREFGGVTYIRGEFFRKFDDLLVKYGM